MALDIGLVVLVWAGVVTTSLFGAYILLELVGQYRRHF